MTRVNIPPDADADVYLQAFRSFPKTGSPILSCPLCGEPCEELGCSQVCLNHDTPGWCQVLSCQNTDHRHFAFAHLWAEKDFARRLAYVHTEVHGVRFYYAEEHNTCNPSAIVQAIETFDQASALMWSAE